VRKPCVRDLTPWLIGHPRGEPTPALLDLARAHRVDRLVAWRRNEIDADLRADVVVDEMQVRELNRVLAALDAEGLDPIVMKGAALAHSHYEQSWMRPRLDADLLIPVDAKAHAFNTLRRLGYTQPPVASGSLVSHQAMFVGPGATGYPHVLDVHWRVLNPPLVADVLSYDELRSRACQLSVRGQRMLTPSPPDALVLACVHRAAHHHGVDDLLWILDVHLIAGRLTPVDWRSVVDAAARRRVAAICRAGIQRSIDLFETAVPGHVVDQLDSLLADEPSAIYLKPRLTRFNQLCVDVRALGVRAGLRLVREHVAPTPSYMRRRYGMPSPLQLPALYARRAVRGAVRWFRS
jgi:hypothetical protein